MQLRHLRTFLAVASTSSFTRAAGVVHLTQSSVTEQIQALEAELGTPLFDRSRRRLALTEAGERLVGYAERMLQLDREARTAVEAAAGAHGVLAIGALETLGSRWLPSRLAHLQQAHPKLQLQLEVAGSGELLARLRRGALDACLLFDAPASVDFSRHVVGAVELAIVAPASHSFARQPTVHAADLAGERFLVTRPGCVYRRLFDRATAAWGSEGPLIAGEFDSLAAIHAMVAQGFGCALLPALAVDEADERIVARPWHGDASSVAIHLVVPPSAPSAALRALSTSLDAAASSHQPVAAVHV